MAGGEQWQAPTSPAMAVRHQRALRWIAWLTFLGLAVYNSQSVYFSALEWLALTATIAISVWCMAKPLGVPKYELKEPTHLLGAFVSRTSWGLTFFGAIVTIGGGRGHDCDNFTTSRPVVRRPAV